jgi:crooked neck
LIPHKKFTFAKVWLHKAYFEIRQGRLTAARKTLGRAIGMCPKDRLFRGYIELEQKLYEFERCRTLYEKHVTYNPSGCQTWIKWAELERGLDDLDRARGIFELGISQPVLDMPEVVWKAYIDFEEEEGEYDRTRDLYERLLEKTDHPKVWISYAQFEINIPEEAGVEGEQGEEEAEEGEEEDERPVSEDAKARARAVFERAHKSMKDRELKAERVSLLNAWLAFEKTHGSAEDVEKIQKQMPRKTKKKRKLDDGSWEEYVDYVFPADDQHTQNLSNLLAMAAAWKQTGGSIG